MCVIKKKTLLFLFSYLPFFLSPRLYFYYIVYFIFLSSFFPPYFLSFPPSLHSSIRVDPFDFLSFLLIWNETCKYTKLNNLRNSLKLHTSVTLISYDCIILPPNPCLSFCFCPFLLMNWMYVHLVPLILGTHLIVSVCYQARVTLPCSSSTNSSLALPPRPWAPGRASLTRCPRRHRHRAQHCTRPRVPTSTYRAAKVSPKSARLSVTIQPHTWLDERGTKGACFWNLILVCINVPCS